MTMHRLVKAMSKREEDNTMPVIIATPQVGLFPFLLRNGVVNVL